jgi:hypothetical protein
MQVKENGLTLRLTSGMTADEMEPLWADIIGCLQKYVNRFSDHETIEHIMAEVISGKRDLWIVQDETGKVILTPITEVSIMNGTGIRFLTFAQVGGERVQDALPLMEFIEEWAVHERGVSEFHFPGRVGYRKLLKPYGYEEATVIFTKKANGANSTNEITTNNV